jgi:hypothetical protein
MKRALSLSLVALGVSGASFLSCSTDVSITKETTSSMSSGPTTGPTGPTGPGGTGGASSTSSSSSAGAGGATVGKLATADTDMGQYQALEVTWPGGLTGVPVVAGPFFITDVIGQSGTGFLFTVNDGNCAITPGPHLLNLTDTNGKELHGIRTPVLAGQTLCMMYTTVTVLGFKPY